MNTIKIAGLIASEPVFSHEVVGEKFYEFYIETLRKSDTVDTLPCIVSETYVKDIRNGYSIMISGEVRTRNVPIENAEKSHLEILVFVKEVLEYPGYDCNEFEAAATVCKQPIFRETPLGRQISNVLLAVNRAYGKSDYIPTIFWGRGALRVAELNVGDRLSVEGRLQSRKYIKRIEEEVVEMTAYELSASRFRKED